jgi:hypothetical protein
MDARQVANVRGLFRLFGLIPEDTIAPLEVPPGRGCLVW